MKQRVTRTLLTAALTFSMVLAGHVAASACIHGMRQKVDESAKLLVKAERHLRKGQYRSAMKAVHEATSAKGRISLSTLDRAARITASVTVRSDGAWGKGTKRLRKAKDRRANLEQAVKLLERQVVGRKFDTYLKTRLAEGLAKIGKNAQALEILSDLAKRDLIADAAGWAVLANLRHAAGDTAGRDVAVTTCKKLARKDRMCTRYGKKLEIGSGPAVTAAVR